MAAPGVSIVDGSATIAGSTATVVNGALATTPAAANLVNGVQTRVSLYDAFGNALIFSNDASGVAGLPVVVRSSTGTEATQPYTNTAQAPQAGNATIKASSGRLFAVTVSATGVTPLVITDGAGAQIFALPASPTLNTFPVGVAGNIFSSSLVVVGSVTNPSIVLHYS